MMARRGLLPRLRLAGVLLAVALPIGLAAARVRFQCIRVGGASMEPTLRHGDLLLLDRRAYRHGPPRRGDLVIVWHHGERIVKRVVGLPGEDVEVRRGRLFVDGSVQPCTHPVTPGFLEIRRGHLLGGRYAVLGDNRALSAEEATHAVVGAADIAGRVVGRMTWRDGGSDRAAEEPGGTGHTGTRGGRAGDVPPPAAPGTG